MSIISKIFKKSFISDFVKANPALIHWIELNRAVRSVRIERKDYRGLFPGPSIMQEANNKILKNNQKNKRVSEVLKKYLLVALGGPSYLVSGLMTRHGHYIGRSNLKNHLYYYLYSLFDLNCRLYRCDGTRRSNSHQSRFKEKAQTTIHRGFCCSKRLIFVSL